MALDRVELWLRVRDSARFQAEMAKSSAAVRSLGTTAQRTSGVASAGLMALGRAGLYAASALGAAGGAAGVLGIKYNASMEQNEVAFANFLGSQKRARKELEWLADFAARSPFEFPGLVAADRKLLAFGMTAKESRKVLGSIGDAAAGLGLAGPDIDRMVMALGQIQAKGKLSTEELLQMAELGVPAFAILKKEMGLTGAELEDKLRGGAISAEQGIGALLGGMNKNFKGSMKDQAATFNGQMSTLKDNVMQMLGDITKPLFNWMKDSLLPGINAALPSIKRAIMSVPGIIRGALDSDIGRGIIGFLKRLPGLFKQGFGIAKGFVEDFLDAIAPAEPFFSNILLPILKGVVGALVVGLVGAVKVLIPIFKAFFQVLGFIGQKLAFLKPVFTAIGFVIGTVFGGAILKGIGLLGKLGGVFRLVGAAAKIVLIPIRVWWGLLRVGFGLIGRLVGWLSGKLSPALSGIGGVFKTVGQAAGRVWDAIKDAFNKIVSFITGMPGKIAGAASGMFNGIWEAFKGAINFIIRGWNSLEFTMPKIDLGPLGSVGGWTIGVPDIPELATGGVVRGSGAFIAGEAGPELFSKQGSTVTVTPLPAFSAPGPSYTALPTPNTRFPLRTEVRVGKRVLLDVVGEAVSDELANR